MKLRKDIESDEELRLIAKCSDALGHPARVEFFRYIYRKNLSREMVANKDLVSEFDYAQSTISQHMAKLTQSGLVDVLSKGSTSYYYVNLGRLGRYVNMIKKLND